ARPGAAAPLLRIGPDIEAAGGLGGDGGRARGVRFGGVRAETAGPSRVRLRERLQESEVRRHSCDVELAQGSGAVGSHIGSPAGGAASCGSACRNAMFVGTRATWNSQRVR